jgi:hypothetical protein
MTTGLEGPKLQIHLSNAAKEPNWQQLAPHRANVNMCVAEHAVLIIDNSDNYHWKPWKLEFNREVLNSYRPTGIVVLNGN